MKKLITLLSLLSFSPAFACGIVTCYDYCSNSYVQVTGDTCTTEFDPQNACWKARGVCGTGCFGSVSCYDYCTQNFETFNQADTCTQTYDSQNGCWKADAYCSHN